MLGRTPLTILSWLLGRLVTASVIQYPFQNAHQLLSLKTLQSSPVNKANDVDIKGETYHVQAGRRISISTRAYCNGDEVPVIVHGYTFSDPFIDEDGYRPHLSSARAPPYLEGRVSTNRSDLEVFPLSSPQHQNINVHATANSTECGEVDAGGKILLEILPLLETPPDFSKNTLTRDWVITPPPDFRFGLGNLGNLSTVGFLYKEELNFTQTGWIGVIQLFKSTSGLTFITGEEKVTFHRHEYIHDNLIPPEEDPILQVVRIETGVSSVVSTDSPCTFLSRRMLQFPNMSAAHNEGSYQTTLMFNPSANENAALDLDSIWYPIGGIQWDINGEATWDGEGDNTDLNSWSITNNFHRLVPLEVDFPTWKDYFRPEDAK